MIHTSALHIEGELVVCVCGNLYTNPHTEKADPYFLAFSHHLRRMNAGA